MTHESLIRVPQTRSTFIGTRNEPLSADSFAIENIGKAEIHKVVELKK